MHQKTALSFFGVALLACSAPSARALELLTNGNFEAPVVSAGDHIGTAPSNWTVAFQGTGPTQGPNNLVHGPITGTGATTPLPIYPGDAANGHAQSFDGDGAPVYLTETITPNVTGPVSVSVAFGGRDTGSNSGVGSFWQIFTTGGTLLGTGPAVTPATSAWAATSTAATAFSLTANTAYTFRISLADPDMVDLASVQTVPEPSTLAAASLGAGLLGWLGYKRRRQS